ncbi:4-hydroxy-tetrahydrodipicolinate synthase [Pseudoroseomonas deserti]|uniref:4-hydroxy-tetrahydrodipicolinate synthase n=1 Tax=Teichococcus deserti TaxID=1817963 RepID=A0A1V2GXM7_9PROT|nr:4-hydroxy-tetrahydrodipicolinate synthase [Pseudoroseomonas deserti]ONG46386.1 4-hydroxy-tetrahydrodipicolinate synthase [Pseudoroseomonas deserti]
MRPSFLPLRGAIPALATPFRPGDGALDAAALARLAERAVHRGAGGVVVCGSTGEAAAMTPDEQSRALHAVAEAVGHRVPVIAGATASCTEATVALAVAAEACGAAALLCAAPPYVRPSQEGLRAHLRAVAGACGLPVILYDVPARAGVRFEDATVARLFEDGVVAALKDATGELARPPALRRLCGAELPQLSGDDATALAHLAAGGLGCISVTANLVPGLCAALQQAWRAQDIERAQQLQDWLFPLHQALFAETNPVPVKAALGLLGLCDGAPRLPLLRAGEATRTALHDALQGLMPMEDSLARRRPAPRPACAAVLPG